MKMANPYLNMVLNQTTKLQTAYAPGEQAENRKPMTEADKDFLKGALDSIKGHQDVANEMKAKMATTELIIANFDELEEYAFDVDLAWNMCQFGLFDKLEQNGYKSRELLQLASIASQNNEKVQDASTGFLVKYFHYLATYRDFSVNPNVNGITDKSGEKIVLCSSNISLLSSLVRSHEKHEILFKKSNGLALLVDLLNSSVDDAKMMTKILFFYKTVASKDEILIGLEPEKLFCLHENDENFSRMLVDLYQMVGGDGISIFASEKNVGHQKWKAFQDNVQKRRDLIDD